MSIEAPGENPLPDTRVELVGGPMGGESVIVWLKAALLNNSAMTGNVLGAIMFSSLACGQRLSVAAPSGKPKAQTNPPHAA